MACAEEGKPISSKELELVTSTWSLVAKDLKGNGTKFLLFFFEEHPEHLKLFPFAKVPKEELPNNRRFQAHAFTVLNALNGMFSSLDDLDLVTDLLHKTGENHSKRSIEVMHFEHLKESLLKFYGMVFGDKWTPELENAWTKVLDIVVIKIGAGIKGET